MVNELGNDGTDILGILHGASNWTSKRKDKTQSSELAPDVSPHVLNELPSMSELLPIRVSTRRYTPNSSLEWNDIGHPGFRVFQREHAAHNEYEEDLTKAYAKGINPESPVNRKIAYTTSWKANPNRVAFLVFSPATAADSAVMNKLQEASSSRQFLHMETKSMPLDRFHELMNQGYPVLSAVRPSDDDLLFIDTQYEPLTEGGKGRLARLPQGIKTGVMMEEIDMRNGKVLWTPDVLKDKGLIRDIARAYHKLRLFKPEAQIYFPQGSDTIPQFGDYQKTLIAQALMHMSGKHFNWHSYGPKENGPGFVRLGFSRNKKEIEKQDAYITPTLVDDTVDLIRHSFAHSWLEAHSQWNKLKEKLLG